MKKFLQKKLKDQKGMTLIELLAVIVIIAIIAANAIPAIGGLIDNSRVGAIKSDATNALSAAELYKMDVDTSTTTSVTIAKLIEDQFLEDAGSLEDNTSITFGASASESTISTVAGSPATNGNIVITLDAATKSSIAATPNSQRGADGARTFTIE